MVPREPSVRPGQGLLFPLESVFTLKGNVQEEQESIYSAGQGVEASSVDVCKLVHTSEHYIKIACVIEIVLPGKPNYSQIMERCKV